MFTPMQRFRQTGFQIHESMSGTHEFVSRQGPPGEFPFSFELDWGCDYLVHFLNPFSRAWFLSATSVGSIRVGALAEGAPCQGTLELRYFSEATIRYRMTFSAKGNLYEYIGEKVGIRPWNLHRSHTTCYGVIHELDSGKEISRSLCYFRLTDLPAFLTSFHPVRAGKWKHIS